MAQRSVRPCGQKGARPEFRVRACPRRPRVRSDRRRPQRRLLWAAAALPPRRSTAGAQGPGWRGAVGTCSSDVSAGAARPCGLSLGADGPMRAAGWSASQGGNAPKHLLSPVCVHPVQARLNACPLPAGACIVLPRAAPQSERPREPREPDTAEDAGGQTDHLGQACKRWLEKGCEVFHKPPSFMNSLNPFFQLLKSLFGRRVRSWLRTNAGGAPNTCKSRG